MQLVEQKLALVEKELEYIKAEYEDFMSAVSHDLSGPFRQTAGFSEIILKNNEGIFDQKTRRHFDFIVMGAEKGRTTIDALRNFTHLTRNNAAFVEFNTHELVEEVLKSLSPWVNQSEAKIHLANLPNMVGDKNQMRLVFFHLLKNALLYRDSSGVTEICIRSQNQEDMLTYSVADNGIGVPKKMEKRIFKILKRAVPSDDYPGYGMGLAIAQKIIRRHGGTIEHSRCGEFNTTFNFYVPKSPIEI